VAFATFLKAFGIGLLGRRQRGIRAVPVATAAAVGVLGGLVLAFAVGMPVFVQALGPAVAAMLQSDAVAKMQVGLLLVPATGAPIRLDGTFAFISPTLLAVMTPLLALLPLALFVFSRRAAPRRVPVWYGGEEQDPTQVATTTLTFSNALRTFYSFIYRPTLETEREVAHETNGRPYFIKRLVFSHDVAPIFGPYFFAPLERLTVALAIRLRIVQSGHLNFYLALIGALLVLILFIALF
jgi:hydrogenase-4 component B